MAIVRTVNALSHVHNALEKADREDNQEVKDNAETVLSALVFRLRQKVVKLPDTALKAYDNIRT